MQQITKEQKSQIKALSKTFTDKTLGNSMLRGNCFTVCYPLSIHLHNNGFRNSLVAGKYNDINYINTPHYWIKLEDYSKIIVDPTIKQFDENTDAIYVDIKPRTHTVHSVLDKEQIEGIRGFWIERLLNNGAAYVDTMKKPPQGLYKIDSLLRINLTAASIILTETKQMSLLKGFSKPFLYDEYCEDINKIIQKNWLEHRNLIESLLSDFLSTA
ncbi:hypothetical protein [Ferruginibacter albus]|uniref:hypothetical protein n=1 Tax=Ferruginibacter albus TaxID=2875540 RepID=UPI001CC42EA9|nr:hypothetical protein [Ferruginibacter albus]UAY52730.1 hypothetical protein K9M53_03320 [Ferruginibacter albus]